MWLSVCPEALHTVQPSRSVRFRGGGRFPIRQVTLLLQHYLPFPRPQETHGSALQNQQGPDQVTRKPDEKPKFWNLPPCRIQWAWMKECVWEG